LKAQTATVLINHECASVNYTESTPTEAQLLSLVGLCPAAIFSNVKVATTFFGLSLLRCDEVAESFAGDIMFDMPDDTRCRQFADYVVDNFVDEDSDFPLTLWAHAPDLMPVTTSRVLSWTSKR